MENQINKLIKPILERENMSAGVVTIKDANVEIADGFMSKIYRVNVSKHQEDSTTNKHELNLIIKASPTDPALGALMRLLYASETHFYETIAPSFNRLQMKYTRKPFDFVPKFYGVVKDGTQEFIVLEDLSSKGYQMLNRKIVFTDDCLKLVLEELGKFHALSFALQQDDPELWKKLDNGVDPCEIITEEVIEWFRDALKKAYELFAAEAAVSEKLKLLHDDLMSEAKKLWQPSKKCPSVIVHIDPWCNNLLFKHDRCKEIEDVVLIDFQTVSKLSPVLDVSCFMYNNASKEAIDNWQEMLRVYYHSLSEHGRALNCRVEEIYSWEMFMGDWKYYAKYGVIKAIVGISLNTQEEEDIKAHDANNIGANFFVEKWNEKTIERMKGLVRHAATEKLLEPLP